MAKELGLGLGTRGFGFANADLVVVLVLVLVLALVLVAFYDFESVLQPVIFACQRSVEATLLCSCFISRINDTACALAGPS